MPYKTKEQRAEYQRQYRKIHKDRVRDSKRKYYQNHREEIISKVKHKEQIQLKTNINFRLRKNLRCRLYQAIKNNYRGGSAVQDLGCSIEDFRKYIENKFEIGMTWNNYGQWHLDHIIPLAKFNLSNRQEFLQACHYTNYQPLWAEDNIKKGNRI